MHPKPRFEMNQTAGELKKITETNYVTAFLVHKVNKGMKVNMYLM